MMGTGMQKLIVVGTVVAALGLVGPAFGKPALPEGYQLPSADPGAWSPIAVKALGERGEAMARFYEQSTGYSPQALQALGERGQAMARYFEESTGFTPQALQALAEQSKGTYAGAAIVSPQVANQRDLERLSALDANQRQVEPSRPVVVSGNGSSFDWGTVGIGAGTAALIAALGLAGILGIRARSTVAHP
jgi:hypothetical protein